MLNTLIHNIQDFFMAHKIQSPQSKDTPYFIQFRTTDSMNQLPASLFILNLLFLKIFEADCKSSNALRKKLFSVTIKVNTSVFVWTRQHSSIFCSQKTDSLLLPLKTFSPKELFNFSLQCVLMNIWNTGACFQRFLNDRSELYPLKQQQRRCKAEDDGG